MAEIQYVTVEQKKLKTAKRRKKYWNYFIAYLFLLPAIVLFFTFFYLPSFAGVYYSFTDYNIFSPAHFIGFQNYVHMFHDPIFLKGLKNSFEYFLILVPSAVILPLLLAVLVNQNLKGISVFRLIYYLPVVTPMIAVGIGWMFIYNQAGLLNSVLKFIGLGGNTTWLLNIKTALPSVSAVEVWKSAGYFMIIYLAGLQAVQKNLIEAARIDGANGFRVLWHVYIPQLRPIIAITLILSTLSSVRTFTSVFVMTGGGPLHSTMSLPIYLYQEAFVDRHMGYASAMGIVLWVILMILTLLNIKASRGGKML